jgi:hypothetical protein
MIKNTTFTWLPQPSTVIGLGVLAGTSCYLITGGSGLGRYCCGVVKILIPDNSTGGDRVFEVIAMLAETAGKPFRASAARPSVASGAPGNDQGPPCREAPEKPANDRISEQG